MIKDIANLHRVDGIDVAYNAFLEFPGVVKYDSVWETREGIMTDVYGEQMKLEVFTDPEGFINAYSFTVEDACGVLVDYGGDGLDENDDREELVNNMSNMIREWVGE